MLPGRERFSVQRFAPRSPPASSRGKELALPSHLFLFDTFVNICYTPLMKTIITAKLKLHPDSAQFQALRHTQLAYRAALNFVSQYSFAHGKMSNQRALQRDCYEEIRLKYGLPAQMACNVPRQVGATYKTLWTKVRQNAAARKAGHTKKRYKGLDNPPSTSLPPLPITSIGTIASSQMSR